MTLEEAVYKTTFLPARRLKIEKRGLIKPGYFADLLIFSPEETGTKATYLKPDIPADGIHHVMVNGDWEVYKGKLTGKLNGKVLHN